jgi:cytochrome c1
LVIANSAKGYRNARGKAPDFELATGEGVSDDENVANVESAEGAGDLRVSDEDGALVLRDKDGKMRGHVSFRPESPPHVLAEKTAWNAVLKAGESEMGEDLHADDQAASADDAGAADPALAAAAKTANDTIEGPGAGAESEGNSDQPESLVATAPANGAVEGAPKSDSLWTWISLILALLIAGVFLVKRRS